ncbi:MAG: ABC transporter permease subunit [Spirochaetaceae bacterium]|nr:ABC transporter permease subunit [Spirochaetaceae bacterium]MBP5793868.1 ABC transporter permease subunit [Spirochaetaceae bacterium]
MMNRIVKSQKFVTFVWVLGLVIVWELGAFVIAGTKRTPENVLPHLWQIVQSVFSTKKVTANQTAVQVVLINAGITLGRAVVGFVIGALSGYVLAILMRRFTSIEKIAFPYLMLIQLIPILGMAPVVLAITQDINKSRIVIAAILTFYPVAVNTLAGLKAIEKEKLELFYSYAAKSYEVYQKLMIPASIPSLFTGLKIAAPMAVTASILVDTLQGGGGLGCMLSQSLKHAMSIFVFWQIVFFSAIVGILSFYLMVLLEKIFVPGARAAKQRRT